MSKRLKGHSHFVSCIDISNDGRKEFEKWPLNQAILGEPEMLEKTEERIHFLQICWGPGGKKAVVGWVFSMDLHGPSHPWGHREIPRTPLKCLCLPSTEAHTIICNRDHTHHLHHITYTVIKKKSDSSLHYIARH